MYWCRWWVYIAVMKWPLQNVYLQMPLFSYLMHINLYCHFWFIIFLASKAYCCEVASVFAPHEEFLVQGWYFHVHLIGVCILHCLLSFISSISLANFYLVCYVPFSNVIKTWCILYIKIISGWFDNVSYHIIDS